MRKIKKYNYFINENKQPDIEEMNKIWERDNTNEFAVPAWNVMYFDHNLSDLIPENADSKFVIFDMNMEYNESPTYVLVHTLWIESTEENIETDIASSTTLDFSDKEAVMKAVQDYINNYEKSQTAKKFNL